jgi:hypothetical protein
MRNQNIEKSDFVRFVEVFRQQLLIWNTLKINNTQELCTLLYGYSIWNQHGVLLVHSQLILLTAFQITMAEFAKTFLGNVLKKAEKYFKKEDDKERTRQLIIEDVYLYTTRCKEPLSFTYEVGSQCSKTLRVTLDFTGSINFTAFDENNAPLNDLRISAVIVPFHRKSIGSMRQGDPRIASRLAVDYIWELVEVDQEKIRAAADLHQIRVTQALQQQAQSGTGHFIDTAFPPCR